MTDIQLSRPNARGVLMLVVVGIALIAAAWGADLAWFDRHFLPDFFIARAVRVSVLQALRIVVAMIGLGMVAVGLARTRQPAQSQSFPSRSGRETLVLAALIMGALAAAALATEMELRTKAWHALKFHGRGEPLRIADAQVGWVFLPNHRGSALVAGRKVDYVTDENGFRVPDASQSLDFGRPTIIFSGESVFAGDGLQWRETIPAQVGARLGAQVADLAVNGYSTDQSLIRLRAELPRFRCPIAVVTIFMTSFLDRNLNDDRPHLDAHLRWHPGRQSWRIEQLARLAVDYRSENAIDAGIAMTQGALEEARTLARARGAIPLLVVPVFEPESSPERALRRRILNDRGIDYLFVPIDSRRRIPGNLHPDAVGAAMIAEAIASRIATNKSSCRS